MSRGVNSVGGHSILLSGHQNKSAILLPYDWSIRVFPRWTCVDLELNFEHLESIQSVDSGMAQVDLQLPVVFCTYQTENDSRLPSCSRCGGRRRPVLGEEAGPDTFRAASSGVIPGVWSNVFDHKVQSAVRTRKLI